MKSGGAEHGMYSSKNDAMLCTSFKMNCSQKISFVSSFDDVDGDDPATNLKIHQGLRRTRKDYEF